MAEEAIVEHHYYKKVQHSDFFHDNPCIYSDRVITMKAEL